MPPGKGRGDSCFLMGLKNLPNITSQLIAHGKDPKTPAAVMQEGTTARQAIAVGTLEDIVEEAQKKGIKTPAISIIGDVVSLQKDTSWFGKKPLSGKSVLVTATKAMAEDLSGKITELGGEAVDFSLVRTAPLINSEMRRAVDDIESYTWAVFTSKNGVDIFFDYIKEAHMDIRRLVNLKFAVIGDGTARALEAHGIFSDFMPASYSSALARALIPQLKKRDKLILLRAGKPRRTYERFG